MPLALERQSFFIKLTPCRLPPPPSLGALNLPPASTYSTTARNCSKLTMAQLCSSPLLAPSPLPPPVLPSPLRGPWLRGLLPQWSASSAGSPRPSRWHGDTYGDRFWDNAHPPPHKCSPGWTACSITFCLCCVTLESCG
eukprot:EG_transcript_13960